MDGGIIKNSYQNNTNQNKSADPRQDQIFNSWEPYAIVMCVQIVLYLCITLFLEKRKLSMKADGKQIGNNLQVVQNSDEGVNREALRVTSSVNQDPIKAINLQKIYSNGFHAVKGTTFGVEKGSIFGLLGPNGAGKSTTFNIITANIPKSDGNAYLNGLEVSQESSSFSYFRDIGVCPQSNCLWEYLNVREHLQVFGRVKGLKGQGLQETVNYYEAQMQLKSYKGKSVNLSGGNKRKLCVANALIGSPSLQFFDEPSTGLDPIAKRYLWRCLRENLITKNSSIVLTTHSLQEAEDLCGKIGIQVNGQFVCLDSLQTLKTQKGDGYKFIVRLHSNSQNADEVKNMIVNAFPNALLLVSPEPDRLLYKLGSENFQFSKAFELLHDTLKKQNLIEDFSISQATLEEIFIYYSSFQINQPQVTN